MNITFGCAVSDRRLLESCLLRSPDLAGCELLVQENYESAARAYNDVIAKARNDVLVFLHQDMYLPDGWIEKLQGAIQEIEAFDKNWGVLGLYGISQDGCRFGSIYCTGTEALLSEDPPAIRRIRVLDEILLVFKRSRGLRFDERIPGFHLYAADLCLSAESTGLSNYMIPCLALHNTSGIKSLPLAFWRGYIYLRMKWRRVLPVVTPCVTISRFSLQAIKEVVQRFYAYRILGRSKGQRVADPALLFDRVKLGSLSFKEQSQ